MTRANGAGGPLRILLVDDDEVDRMAVRRALKATEIDVDVVDAGTVAQAIQLLQERPFDCAVVDYNLPDGDGGDVLSAAADADDPVPTLFLTGQGDEGLAVNLMKEGARDYIPKSTLSATRLAQSLRYVVEVSRAELEARRARRGQEFLVDAGVQLAQSLEFEDAAQRLAEAPVPEFADFALLHLVEEDGSVRRVATAHVDPIMAGELREPELNRLRERGGAPFDAIRMGRPVLVQQVDDAWLDVTPEGGSHRELLRRLAPVSLLIAPLTARGRTLGTLTLGYSTSDRRYGDADVHVAWNLASQGALALDNARLFEELGDEMRLVEILHAFGNEVTSHLDLDTVAQTATDEGTVQTRAEAGAFFYNAHDELGDHYTLHTLAGIPREEIRATGFPVENDLFGRAFGVESVVRVSDVTRDARWAEIEPHLGLDIPVRSFVAVPVSLPGNEIIGALFFAHSRPAMFHGRHERIVQGIARWTAVAVQNARLFRQAQQAAQARDEMLAVVSHDLRNPLNVIAASASLILEIPLPEEKKLLQLEVIRRTTDRMNRLIQDLLDLSGIEAGKLSVHPEPLDVDLALDEACEMMGPLAAERGLHVVCREATLPQVVYVDRERILQVFSNLMGNAIRFTPQGGTITLGAERDGDTIAFYVEDTGPGIPPEDLPRLFDRFWKGKQSSGTGLGLPIAKGIVEVHGGDLTVLTQLGRGTRFRFTIPIASASSPRPAPPEIRTRQKV